MIVVREGIKEDIQQVFDLIMELAIFEKGEDEVINTPQKMLQEAFSKKPTFGFFVAEKNGKIVGTSIYYVRYSTWKGSTLYLEDLIVTERERGKGIGAELFNKTIELASKKGYQRLSWQVLNWNQQAIDFYKGFDATFDEEWINCHLNVGVNQKY